MVSPTETCANCKRCNFLSLFCRRSPCFGCFPKNILTPTLCRQLAGQGSSWRTLASAPTSRPNQVAQPAALRRARLFPQLFICFHPLPRHKRWCAAVTETATPASVNCGDGRAVKGWRWQTTRTAKPQSKLKKPAKELSNVDPSPDIHPDLHCTALHWFLFGCF